MKLNSSSLVLVAFFALATTVESFAAIKPVAFRCSQYIPEPDPDDPVYIQNGPYICKISQFDDVDEAVAHNYTDSEIFDSWSDLVAQLTGSLVTSAQNCEMDPNSCTGVSIDFETSIDLGGFEVSNGDTVCVNTFDPVLIPVDYVLKINGNGNTIKGYCDIGEGNKSFFKGVENFGRTGESIVAVQNAQFNDLHFDGAYVKATGDGARAAVLAEQSYGIAFNNVSVANSVISASHTAGGLVGNYETAYDDITSVHVDAVLRGVHVGGLFGEAIFASAEMASSVSNISVDIEVYAVGEDSVAAGGFAGQFTMRDANIVFSNDTVTLVMPNGATTVVAGGLVGNFLYDASRSVEMLNLGNIIDISVNSTGYIAYAGGLVGMGSFENVAVTDSLNKIHAVIAAKGSGVGTVAAGGEFGQITGANSVLVAQETIDARLVAAGSQIQRLGGVAGNVQMATAGALYLQQNSVKASVASTGTENVKTAMGGLLGYALVTSGQSGNFQGIETREDDVRVSMEAASTEEIYAGGIAGYLEGQDESGGTRACLHSISTTIKAIEGKDLINVSSENAKHLYAGGVVGIIRSSTNQNLIRRVRVDGNINIAADDFTDSSAVGGLVGELYSTGVYVYDNVNSGNILAKTPSMGYAVGKAVLANRGSNLKLYANVHYGDEDGNVKSVAGSMWKLVIDASTGDSTYTLVENWDKEEQYLEGYRYNVRFNYRNAIEAGNVLLEPTGTLNLTGDGAIKVGEEYIYNGVLDDSMMKSRLLTYALGQKGNYRDYDDLDTARDYSRAFAYWENDADSMLKVCSNAYDRTVYQVTVNIDDIYAKLTDEDKKSLKGILDSTSGNETTSYNLVTYTEKNKRVSENFLKRARALSVDYGVLLESEKMDLETHVFGSDQSLMAEENSSFYVVYEVREVVDNEDTGNYVSLDATLLYPVYLWPKMTQVNRYNEHSVIPPVYVTSGGAKQEYYMSGYFVNCRAGESCEPVVLNGELGGLGSFAELIDDFVTDYGPQYSDTIHLVYEPSQFGNSAAPTLSLGVGGYQYLEFTGYGYKDGQLTVADTATAGGYSTTQFVPMASKYSVEPEPGFALKKWKADLWMHTTGSQNIEDCYYGNLAEYCTDAAKFETAKNYFASSGTILNAMREYEGGEEYLKWSTELDADSMLVMDSVVSAIARKSGLSINRSYYYHLHVEPELEAISYAIHFDVNAGDLPVFVAGYTDTLAFYSRESSSLLDLYTTDTTKCFGGWSANAEEPLYSSRELDGDLIKTVTPVDDMFSLYGTWHDALANDPTGADGKVDEVMNECPDVQTTELALHYLGAAGSEGGEVYLWQRVVNPDDTLTFRHDFKDSTMDVPINHDAMFRFHVGAAAKPGYTLSQAMLVRSEPFMQQDQPIEESVPDAPENVADTIWLDIPNGGDMIEVSYDWRGYALYATFETYIAVTFDLNTDQDEVFYDPRFVLGDSLVVINNDDQVELPSRVYTVNSCMDGWSVESDAEKGEFHVMTYNDKLYREAYDTKKLYAVWRNAQDCVDSLGYVRVSAKAENGNLEIVEEGEEENRVHRFGADGSLILPAWSDGIFVNATPDDGYELDHIALVQSGDTVRVENGGWLDVQEDEIKLIAYFVEITDSIADSIEVAEPELRTSGNAVRFRFVSEDFVRGFEPWVYVTLENDDGEKQADTLYCKMDGCDVVWEKFPLRAGYYLFTASARVLDGLDTVLLERDFEVDAAISIAGEDTWQMISLASVDLDEVSWDGDEKFYWWAEDRNYGKYWQYQELTKGQVPDPERGYWYSSIEGRPLVLKDEFFYEENVTWNLENVNSGWNLVANPFGWYLDIGAPEPIDEDWFMEEMHNRGEDLDEEYLEEEWNNMQPSVEFWRWNAEAGAPEPCYGTFTLKPYEAVWVKLNDSVPMTWELDTYPSFLESVDAHGEKHLNKSLNRRLAKESGKNGWSLRLALSDGKGKKDSWNTLGVGKFIRKSEEPPAGMGDRVNLSIVEGGKRLAKSVKAETAAAAYEWNVELSATSARNGFLEISGIADLEARGFAVYVEVDGNTTRMQDGVPLKVALTPASKSARVYVSGTPKVALSKSLEGLRAVQAGAMLQVGFVAGEGLAGSAVRVDVLDLKGNVVRSAGAQALNGTNQVSLDAPKPGIYMLRVRAGSQMRAGRILVK